MHSKTLAFALLCAVTSAERAAAIEGDLLEEREKHGSLWFALHVLQTTLALFGLALARAPFRTAALGMVAIAMSYLVCALVDWLFFSSQALIPLPLIGLTATCASAASIGAALGRFAGALGVRAAIMACAVLSLMFVASRIAALPTSSPIDAAAAPATTFGLLVAQLALGLCVFLGPLLSASCYVHLRRT